MIQLQAINNILSNNNISEYLDAGIERKHLQEYSSHYDYILEHYNKYDKVPDLATFLMRFDEFDVVEVYEPVQFIINGLLEDYNYTECVRIAQKFAEIAVKDSYEALNYIAGEAEQLLNLTPTKEKTDINDSVEEKIQDLDNKRGTEGLLGITTGFKELDRILMGWQNGQELVTIVGRVNQGKSWLLLKFLSAAHQAGKKVLLYSGEMSKFSVAYRTDTLGMNYSNRQLTFGTISDADYEQYKKDIKKNAERLQEYNVYTPKDLGGKLLDIPTLRHLIKKHKPDIVGIDQLSLMTDYRHAREKRLQLANITMDLFNLSEEFGIPILADAQANRNRADAENPESPELTDLAESDAIGQNSSRVISLVQTKAGLKLKITKNRYGENNKSIYYVWDIDVGTFRHTEVDDDNSKVSYEDNNVEIKPQNNKSRRKERKKAEDFF